MSASALVTCQYGAWYARYQQLAPASIIIPLSEGFTACLAQVGGEEALISSWCSLCSCGITLQTGTKRLKRVVTRLASGRCKPLHCYSSCICSHNTAT